MKTKRRNSIQQRNTWKRERDRENKSILQQQQHHQPRERVMDVDNYHLVKLALCGKSLKLELIFYYCPSCIDPHFKGVKIDSKMIN